MSLFSASLNHLKAYFFRFFFINCMVFYFLSMSLFFSYGLTRVEKINLLAIAFFYVLEYHIVNNYLIEYFLLE